MREWAVLVWLAVEFSFLAATIFTGQGLGALGSTIGKTATEDQERLAIVAELRVFNKYDNTKIYAQDMVAALLEFRGQPICKVTTKGGTVYTYYPTYSVSGGTTSPVSAYATEALQSRFITARDTEAASDTYKCEIQRDLNGVVEVITFVYTEV